MNQRVVRPAAFRGVIDVPTDKSITHRAVMLSALASGLSVIKNPLEADDCLSTLACVKSLGCDVTHRPGEWTVRGRGLWGFRTPPGFLDCGNSGTTMRLLSGIMAAQPFTCEMRGDASLSTRPMERVAEPLRAMGAQVTLTGGKFAPMSIRGQKPLKSLYWRSPIASAQVKSCVLLAGLHADGETTFEEPTLSRDHTERMLAAAGAVVRRDGARVTVRGMPSLRAMEWAVPSDISSAAFFLVAGLIVDGADVTVRHVNLNPTRTGLLDVLRAMGGRIDEVNAGDVGGEPAADLVVRGRQPLRAATIDKTIAPRLIDEIPILAVAATQAAGVTRFTGIGELRVKETDRIAAIARNLQLMGANVRELEDGLVIEGPTPLKAAQLDSYDDHRIAMAFGVAGLVADGETVIENASAVSISFPGFWPLLDKLVRP